MKTKYLSHKLTEKIEVNREQAAEILSDLKRYTAAFPNLHQDDTLSSLKEKSIFYIIMFLWRKISKWLWKQKKH
ncbi:hypothetical protein HMPREF9466_01412 [Fusobacterium necrophorum subsp. funduliforme 1_1_36S]|nr:hypothetical protein HMPREF9466_01412 [Fusobacterium necrophorum subsp. funduliforme 1_1_36S]